MGEGAVIVVVNGEGRKLKGLKNRGGKRKTREGDEDGDKRKE